MVRITESKVSPYDSFNSLLVIGVPPAPPDTDQTNLIKLVDRYPCPPPVPTSNSDVALLIFGVATV